MIPCTFIENRRFPNSGCSSTVPSAACVCNKNDQYTHTQHSTLIPCTFIEKRRCLGCPGTLSSMASRSPALLCSSMHTTQIRLHQHSLYSDMAPGSSRLLRALRLMTQADYLCIVSTHLWTLGSECRNIPYCKSCFCPLC